MVNEVKSPVLFLNFNRPEKTRRVFDVIRSVRPSKLYVAVDGPRETVPTDLQNCLKVREIVQQVDWKCSPRFLFHEKNLGCSLSGKTAWDWIFSQEEEMIFIEDDGLVSKSFFWFCQELLEKYRDNKKIAYISGENFGSKYGEYSYFFTRIGGGTYNMATWKRVHDLYEFNMDSYPVTRMKEEFRKSYVNNFAFRYETSKYDKYLRNGGNTYDLQMGYLQFKHDMYCIVPNTNMCSNIGFDETATNTVVEVNGDIAGKYGNRPRYELSEILHPKEFSVDKQFEKEYYRLRLLQGRSWFSVITDYYVNRYFPLLGKISRRIVRLFKSILKNRDINRI